MRRRIIIMIFQKHRALYCWMVLLLWIFFLVIGLYRYLGIDSSLPYQTFTNAEKLFSLDAESSKLVWTLQNKSKKLYKSCNPIGSIAAGSEGSVDESYSLEGVVIVLRHGDRGPINHVQNLNTISCNYEEEKNSSQLYYDYISYVTSHWISPSSNGLYQYDGQHNTHPPLPTSKLCEIGQLTLTGVTQHLKLGSVLRKIYFKKLFGNATQTNNVFAYTTKYRRTFQSLNAFLYGFLKDRFSKIPLYTANSMYFCFDECACSAIDVYNRAVISDSSKRLKSHPVIFELIEKIASVVYTMSDKSFAKDPHYVKDAMLTYICHNTFLPCSSTKCVQPDDVSRVFSYIDWDIRQLARSYRRRQVSLLSSYGLLKSIVSHVLKFVSNEKPNVVLYSAHDKTIQRLLTSLGVTLNEAITPPYASRTIFEIYSEKQNDSSYKKYYFRIVFNGKDVTHLCRFCSYENRIVLSSRPKISLCPFETLLRFLHDDYFAIFGVTNFKDACATRN